MPEIEPQEQSEKQPTPQAGAEHLGLIAMATTQICLVTIVLVGTLCISQMILGAGRNLHHFRLSARFTLAIIPFAPFLMNIAAAQRTRYSPLLSTNLLILTSVACVWHLLILRYFGFSEHGKFQMPGIVGAFNLLFLLAHFILSAVFILIAVVVDRELRIGLFLKHLRQDLVTKFPKSVGALYGMTALGLCLLAANESRRFLKPEHSVSLPEYYQISALSDDLQILAIGNSHGNFMSRGTETTLILLDAKTLEPVTQPVPLPQSVSQLRFISPEFGYLAMLAHGKYRGLPNGTSAAPASLVQVKTDGTVRQIRDGLPNDVHNLELSVHRDIAAVVCMNQETREASVHFIRLIDGNVLSSYSFSDVVTYELQFLRESDRAILLVEKPNLNHPNSWTCQLLGVHENSVEEVLQNMSTYGPQTAKPVSSTPGVHEFNTSGALISIWFDANHWCYRFGPPELRSNEPHNFVRHASDRMVFAENYAGSSWGNTILFYQGDPPELIDRRIESDDELNDLEFCPDGSRLFLLETVKHVGTRVSVYRFPES